MTDPIQRYEVALDAWVPGDDGEFVTYAEHVTAMEALNDEHLSEMLRVIEVHAEALRQAATRERLSGQVQMMDEIARCIADGHRGNGSAEDDVCCQVCQEIQCDPDCAIAVHVEALRQARAAGKEEAYEEMNGERQAWPGPRGFDFDKGYEQGQRDALAQAVQRVEALWVHEVTHGPGWTDEKHVWPTQRSVIAAIKEDKP